MKHAHTTLAKLSHHVLVVTHVDHYSNFLLQQMKEGTIIILTLNDSNIFVSLCVKKQGNKIFLNRTSSVTEQEKEDAILFEFPTYYYEKKIKQYELFFQKEVKVVGDRDGISRILLIWIQQSFYYRYSNKERESLSILTDKKTHYLKVILRYWFYYAYIRIKRRQC